MFYYETLYVAKRDPRTSVISKYHTHFEFAFDWVGLNSLYVNGTKNITKVFVIKFYSSP